MGIFCDICGEKDNNASSIHWQWGREGTRREYDLCTDCINKIEKMIKEFKKQTQRRD